MALVTRDIDATIRLYGDVQVGEVVGRDGSALGLHFFEVQDAVARPGSLQERFSMQKVGAHHIAFGMPDEAAGLALRKRLEEHGVETTPIGDAGPVRSTLSPDNSGFLLGAA